MISFGVPTPSITRATNEWTVAMSAATFGTSAMSVQPVKVAAAVSEISFLDISLYMI